MTGWGAVNVGGVRDGRRECTEGGEELEGWVRVKGKKLRVVMVRKRGRGGCEGGREGDVVVGAVPGGREVGGVMRVNREGKESGCCEGRENEWILLGCRKVKGTRLVF